MAKQQPSVATFAAGCFWCIEATFEHLPGVTAAYAGYTGGKKANPTYEDVTSQTTGHYEAIEVHFDPKKLSYDQLLDVFWRNIDPTDNGGQFVDRGSSYKTAIFYHTDEQQQKAEQSKKALIDSGKFDKSIVTPILPAVPFYPAEEYHQASPFASRISQLTPLQRNVTQACSTEPPFHNAYWNNHEEGIYVDIVSGEPLFSSRDKFDSGTGWPSFTRPIEKNAVIEKQDTSHGMNRTELKSAKAGSHLGHVFSDGPKETGGLRYCMNSASLRFIPAKDLENDQ